MPPPWVWCVFFLAVTILTASMVTLREGRRFVSRDLTEEEVRIVAAAITLWEKAAPEGERTNRLRAMLGDRRLRVMDTPSFVRAQERSTYGYTDERGRVLLNPRLCFANHDLLPEIGAAPSPCIQCADLVATLTTLYHETTHLFEGASEATAYEEEWLFLRRLSAYASRQRDGSLLEELGDWEKAMPSRVELCLGAETTAEIRGRVLRQEP